MSTGEPASPVVLPQPSADELAKISAGVQVELRERAEALVAHYGAAAAGAAQHARLHDALLRCAKDFAAQQPTLDETAAMLGQLHALVAHLQSETDRLEAHVQRLPALDDALRRTAADVAPVSEHAFTD